MTLHAMIDLETLGRQAGCPVLSLGACAFHPTKGVVSEKPFYVVFDLRSVHEAGLDDYHPETVTWWIAQESDRARNEISGGTETVDLRTGLLGFEDWLDQVVGKGAPVWAKGASLDFPILEAAFNAVGRKEPWHFRNERCSRTLFGLAEVLGLQVEAPKRVDADGAHTALYDAMVQAGQVVSAFRALEHFRPDRSVFRLIYEATRSARHHAASTTDLAEQARHLRAAVEVAEARASEGCLVLEPRDGVDEGEPR